MPVWTLDFRFRSALRRERSTVSDPTQPHFVKCYREAPAKILVVIHARTKESERVSAGAAKAANLPIHHRVAKPEAGGQQLTGGPVQRLGRPVSGRGAAARARSGAHAISARKAPIMLVCSPPVPGHTSPSRTLTCWSATPTAGRKSAMYAIAPPQKFTIAGQFSRTPRGQFGRLARGHLCRTTNGQLAHN